MDGWRDGYESWVRRMKKQEAERRQNECPCMISEMMRTRVSQSVSDGDERMMSTACLSFVNREQEEECMRDNNETTTRRRGAAG